MYGKPGSSFILYIGIPIYWNLLYAIGEMYVYSYAFRLEIGKKSYRIKLVFTLDSILLRCIKLLLRTSYNCLLEK